MYSCIVSVIRIATYRIAGYLPLGANFPKSWTCSFSRNFPDLEIRNPNNQSISCDQ